MSVSEVERADRPATEPRTGGGDVLVEAVITILYPVDREDQGASGGNPGDDWGDDADTDGMLGWISPDDRLWRHPSESGTSTGAPSTILLGRDRRANQIRSGTWLAGGTAACLVLVLVASGLVMATTGSADPDNSLSNSGAILTASPTTEPGVKPVTTLAGISAMVSSIRQSIVVMKIKKSTGTTVTTGLVAEAGGIIVTTAGALSGARAITVIEPGGSSSAGELIGIDQPTGLAVVRIGDDLPAATFDNSDPSTGAVAIAMALEPGRPANARPFPVVYAGDVLSVGQAMGADPVTSTFAATALQAPLSHDDLGCPLLDSVGHVSGLLERTVQAGSSTISVFLPAQLVLGVTRQLVSSGAVIHGWLGVDTSKAGATTTLTSTVNTAAPTATGAEVISVNAAGPAAAGGLQPSDIITGIDGDRVQSSAELQTRLYPDPPGTSLVVEFTRGGTPLSTTVTLASSDADAQGSQSSP